MKKKRKGQKLFTETCLYGHATKSSKGNRCVPFCWCCPRKSSKGSSWQIKPISREEPTHANLDWGAARATRRRRRRRTQGNRSSFKRSRRHRDSNFPFAPSWPSFLACSAMGVESVQPTPAATAEQAQDLIDVSPKPPRTPGCRVLLPLLVCSVFVFIGVDCLCD